MMLSKSATAIAVMLSVSVAAGADRPYRPVGERESGYTMSTRDGSARKAAPRQFAEIEVLLDNAVSLAELRALPQAPGGALTLLDEPARAVLQVPVDVIAWLTAGGAYVEVKREFVLVASDGSSSSDAGGRSAFCYGENDADVVIPDEGDWVYSPILIDGCGPVGATVSLVDVHYEIEHAFVGDLNVDLTDEDGIIIWRLWDDFFGPPDINETELNITAFNGEPVNQQWRLRAKDFDPPDEGSITYWWIKVYYDSGELPDLVLESSSLEPQFGVEPGGPMLLSDTVRNQGTATALSHFFVTWFISVDPTVTADDFEWVFRNVDCCLAVDATSTEADEVSWPIGPTLNMPGQTYYVAAMADDSFFVDELDEENNWSQVWPVTLLDPSAPTIVASAPEACSVDARQPADPDGFIATDWWTSVVLTFDGSTAGMMPEDFTAETDQGGVAVPVDEVVPVGDTVKVRFGEVIPAGEWTCLYHLASASEVCLGSLPGDVDGDRLTDEVDASSLMDCLEAGGCDARECDIDRQGICTTADVTRWVDLVNGAGTYDSWQDVSIVACPSAL